MTLSATPRWCCSRAMCQTSLFFLLTSQQHHLHLPRIHPHPDVDAKNSPSVLSLPSQQHLLHLPRAPPRPDDGAQGPWLTFRLSLPLSPPPFTFTFIKSFNLSSLCPRSNTIFIYHAFTHAQLVVLKGHVSVVTAMAFSPDERSLVSVGAGGSV